MTLAQLYRNYIAAGFPPDGFWALTPRLYALQMHAALARMKIEMAMRNRTAWNTAALVGAAMVGKLPRYHEFFRTEEAVQRGPQSPEQQDAALRVLAAAWGAATSLPKAEREDAQPDLDR